MSEISNTEETKPNLANAVAQFKRELKDLSKNELVRQASDFYIRLILQSYKINDMESQIKVLNEQLSSSKQSKESHD